jgi:hypothetical protein
LTRDPLPLYSEVLDIGLLWNARAACSFAVKWLFFQEGVLDEALAYSPWPHQYRQQVYCSRPGYKQKLARIADLGPRAMKFVRNPFDRAVGSYLALSRQAYRRSDPQHDRMLRRMSRHLRRPVGGEALFTFREFVDVLGTLELATADIHVRLQSHPCERAGELQDMTIVRVEESHVRLPALEMELGLRPSDVGLLRRSVHDTTRVASSRFVGDERFGESVGIPIPVSASFYDADLEEAVRRLYGPDIERYGYAFPSR